MSQIIRLYKACYDIELIVSYIMSHTDDFDVLGLHDIVNQRLKNIKNYLRCMSVSTDHFKVLRDMVHQNNIKNIISK